MRGIRKRGRLVLAVAGATAALAALTLGTTSSSAAPKADGGNITVWLSGTYAGATPGTCARLHIIGHDRRGGGEGGHQRTSPPKASQSQGSAAVAAAPTKPAQKGP